MFLLYLFKPHSVVPSSNFLYSNLFSQQIFSSIIFAFRLKFLDILHPHDILPPFRNFIPLAYINFPFNSSLLFKHHHRSFLYLLQLSISNIPFLCFSIQFHSYFSVSIFFPTNISTVHSPSLPPPLTYSLFSPAIPPFPLFQYAISCSHVFLLSLLFLTFLHHISFFSLFISTISFCLRLPSSSLPFLFLLLSYLSSTSFPPSLPPSTPRSSRGPSRVLLQ